METPSDTLQVCARRRHRARKYTKAYGGLIAKSGGRTVVHRWDDAKDAPYVESDTHAGKDDAAPVGEGGPEAPAVAPPSR